MKLQHLPRLLRTVRHLRYSQLVWRGRYLLDRKISKRSVPRPHQRWQPSAAGAHARDDFPFVPVAHLPCPAGIEVAELAAEGCFHHLNLTKWIGRGQTDWQLGPRREDRLWTITLHYHAWAYALASEAAQGDTRAAALLVDYLSAWIATCHHTSVPARDLAWNSFAIATRLGWWVRTHEVLKHSYLPLWNEFLPVLFASMTEQAEYLEKHLEWDLRGNHLLRDAVGLAWAGRFLAGDRAVRWLELATQLAVDQVNEQVLSDGGHFERSPMYHLHVMEDVYTLALLLEEPTARATMRSAWSRMAEFAAWARHPDGKIPLLNDAAFNGAAQPDEMLALGSTLGLQTDGYPRSGGRYFQDTGLVVWHEPLWSVFFDVGHVAPGYQPGHGHADTLSLEASYEGQRLFADPGTYAYDDDERRAYDRGTASHNTVTIDDADSSEVWSIFRVGRRAVPRNVQVEFGAGRLEALGSHDGYDYLSGSPRHSRKLTVSGGSLVVEDQVTGAGDHRVKGGWLLAPEWEVHSLPQGWRLQSGGRKLLVSIISQCGVRIEISSAVYHPEYGRELQTRRLSWTYQGKLPLMVRTTVEPA